MQEPGLDRHEWETTYAALEEELADDPARALPELADLVDRMLESRGIDQDEPVTEAGDERELSAELDAAREVANRVEANEDVDPGDVASAINGLQSLYRFLVEERAAP